MEGIVPVLTGVTSTAFTITPGPAVTLVLSGFPSPVTAGVANNVTVTAKDAYGNVATAYPGTVTFISSDGQASLPTTGTLAAGTGTDPRWQQLRRVIRTRWSSRSSRRFRIMVIEAQRELAARGDVAPAFVRYRDRTAALREKLAALLPDENPADEVAGA